MFECKELNKPQGLLLLENHEVLEKKKKNLRVPLNPFWEQTNDTI